ncbi:MAG TPA: S8 family serine peptidase, partial [Pyrinomonadaceae bacterium]|nr:S8 family serine peptidase [Pyrinomonadaceae bacterium]
MKHNKHAPVLMWVALLSLLAALCVWPGSEHAHAQAGVDLNAPARLLQGGEKTSPDLRQLARDARTRQARVRVIVQLDERLVGGAVDAQWGAYGARLMRRLENLNTRVLELPVAAAEALAARGDVRFVSLDRENMAFGHVSLTTGADAVRPLAGTNSGELDGTGIGIAVLDSGIDTNHRSFLDRRNGLRVVASRDFTGEQRTDDPYGHGTHVAAIAAGNGRIAQAGYIGI